MSFYSASRLCTLTILPACQYRKLRSASSTGITIKSRELKLDMVCSGRGQTCVIESFLLVHANKPCHFAIDNRQATVSSSPVSYLLGCQHNGIEQ